MRINLFAFWFDCSSWQQQSYPDKIRANNGHNPGVTGQLDDFLLSESTQQFPHFSAAPDIEAIRQLLAPGKTQQSIQRSQGIETVRPEMPHAVPD